MTRRLDLQSAVDLLFTLPPEDDSCSYSESAADSSGPESGNSSGKQDKFESEDVNFEFFEPESDGNQGESASTLEESSGTDDGYEDYGVAHRQ